MKICPFFFIFYYLISNVSSQASRNVSECKLKNSFTWADVAAGFPRIANRIRSLGTVNTAVVFIDFSDVPATKSTFDIFSIMSPAAEDFVSETSYNKLRLRLLPYLKWLRMSKKSSDYGLQRSASYWQLKEYIQEALTLAANENFDIQYADLFIIVTNPEAQSITTGFAFAPSQNSGLTFTIKGKLISNAFISAYDLNYWKSGWLVHEFGHTMALPDLYSYQGSGMGQFMYTGGWSIQGNIGGFGKDFFGWEKWLLGWVEDSQVICLNQKTQKFSVRLSPIEIPDRTYPKIATINLNSTTALVVESRRNLGVDTLSKPGVLTYLVNTNIMSGYGPIRVLPLNLQDNYKENAPISLGSNISYQTVTIQYTATDAFSDTVSISYN